LLQHIHISINHINNGYATPVLERQLFIPNSSNQANDLNASGTIVPGVGCFSNLVLLPKDKVTQGL